MTSPVCEALQGNAIRSKDATSSSWHYYKEQEATRSKGLLVTRGITILEASMGWPIKKRKFQTPWEWVDDTSV